MRWTSAATVRLREERPGPGLAMAAPRVLPLLPLLMQLPGSTPAANVPRWSMIYDFDVTTNGSGTTSFTNVLWVSLPPATCRSSIQQPAGARQPAAASNRMLQQLSTVP